MEQIRERLWIGDAVDGRNVVALQAAGITAVFNATTESDVWPEEYKAVTPYLRLNQQDGEVIPFVLLEKFRDFMDQMYVRDPHVVLVHCGAGISRASSFAILTLMLYHGMDWEVAEAAVRAVRPIIAPHWLLRRSIEVWLAPKTAAESQADGSA